MRLTLKCAKCQFNLTFLWKNPVQYKKYISNQLPQHNFRMRSKLTIRVRKLKVKINLQKQVIYMGDEDI